MRHGDEGYDLRLAPEPKQTNLLKDVYSLQFGVVWHGKSQTKGVAGFREFAGKT